MPPKSFKKPSVSQQVNKPKAAEPAPLGMPTNDERIFLPYSSLHESKTSWR